VQGWAQGSFVEAEAEVEAERLRQRRGKAAMSLTEARQRQRVEHSDSDEKNSIRFDSIHADESIFRFGSIRFDSTI